MEKELNKNPKRESNYTAPAIEVINIETSQNILLGGSNGTGTSDFTPGSGDGWL